MRRALRALHAPHLIYATVIAPREHFPLLHDPLRRTLARRARQL